MRRQPLRIIVHNFIVGLKCPANSEKLQFLSGTIFSRTLYIRYAEANCFYKDTFYILNKIKILRVILTERCNVYVRLCKS